MQVSFDAGDFTEKPRCETCLYWDRYNGQGVCEKTDEKKWPGDVCDDWSQFWRCGEGEPTYFAEFERDGKRYEASGDTPPLAVRRLFDELVERGLAV